MIKLLKYDTRLQTTTNYCFLAPFHPPMPAPVPNPPNASELVNRGAADGGLGGPGFVDCWKVDRKDEVGADWIERNLFSGGRSSLLYFKQDPQFVYKTQRFLY